MIHGVHIPVTDADRLLVFSDLHFRGHDKRFTDILVDFARDFKPHLSLGNGDNFDFNALSKHPKEAKQQVDDGALVDEAESAEEFFAAIRASTRPGGRTLVGAGNHEGRWNRFVNDNPGLSEIPWHTPCTKALDGWEKFDQGYELYVGGLTIAHGDELAGALSKYSCAAVASSYPRENILYGHTHRIDRFTQTLWSNGEPHEHGVWTTGHGQDVAQVEYTKRAKWRLGFAAVVYWKNGRDLGFTVVQHEAFRTGNRLKMHSPLTGKVYTA